MPRKRKRDDHRKLIGYTRVSPASKTNARPRRVHISNGSYSKALLESPLDQRSTLGKLYKQRTVELRAHLANELTAPEASLVDQCVRLSLLSDITWCEIQKAGRLVQDGVLHPSLDAYLKTAKNHREVLNMLGLRRRTRDVSLSQYLAEAAEVHSAVALPEDAITEDCEQ